LRAAGLVEDGGPVTRLSLVAVVTVALVVAAPAAAKSKACGAYSKSDGSLADGVVTNISVVGTSCAGG
jgi:hypothetical protein